MSPAHTSLTDSVLRQPRAVRDSRSHSLVTAFTLARFLLPSRGQSARQGKHLAPLLYLLPIKRSHLTSVFVMSLPWKLTHHQWSPKSVRSASTVEHAQPYYQPHFIVHGPYYYGLLEQRIPACGPDPARGPKMNQRGQQMIKGTFWDILLKRKLSTTLMFCGLETS